MGNPSSLCPFVILALVGISSTFGSGCVRRQDYSNERLVEEAGAPAPEQSAYGHYAITLSKGSLPDGTAAPRISVDSFDPFTGHTQTQPNAPVPGFNPVALVADPYFVIAYDFSRVAISRVIDFDHGALGAFQTVLQVPSATESISSVTTDGVRLFVHHQDRSTLPAVASLRVYEIQGARADSGPFELTTQGSVTVNNAALGIVPVSAGSVLLGFNESLGPSGSLFHLQNFDFGGSASAATDSEAPTQVTWTQQLSSLDFRNILPVALPDSRHLLLSGGAGGLFATADFETGTISLPQGSAGEATAPTAPGVYAIRTAPDPTAAARGDLISWSSELVRVSTDGTAFRTVANLALNGLNPQRVKISPRSDMVYASYWQPAISKATLQVFRISNLESGLKYASLTMAFYRSTGATSTEFIEFLALTSSAP